MARTIGPRRHGLAVALAALTVVALLAQARPVLAHAVLLASYPADGGVLAAAPTSIHLWFSGPVEFSGPAIAVTDPAGQPVAHGPIHNGGIEVSTAVTVTRQGTYLVRWRVIALDTYPSSGSFVFSVGRPAGPFAGMARGGSAQTPLALTLQVAARWLHFLGYALGFGPPLVIAVVLRRAGVPVAAAVPRRLWGLVTAGVAVLLLAEPLALLAQLTSLGGGGQAPADLISSVLASSFGRLLAQRVGAAMLLWALVGAVKAGARRVLPAIVALGAGLALVDAVASHAATAPLPALGLGLHTVHLAAMGTWVGGLAALLAVWPLAERAARPDLLARFGRLAATALGLLAASGALLAVLHLGHPGSLVTTPYGLALAAKTAVVCLVAGLAYRALRARDERRRHWWRLEGAALLIVLVLAGLVVSLPPPR